jgi:hypothetical protein
MKPLPEILWALVLCALLLGLRWVWHRARRARGDGWLLPWLLWAVWMAGLVAAVTDALPDGVLGGALFLTAVAAGGCSLWLRVPRGIATADGAERT